LLNFLQVVLKDQKNKIINLDNAKIHKNEKVKKFITKINFYYLVRCLVINIKCK